MIEYIIANYVAIYWWVALPFFGLGVLFFVLISLIQLCYLFWRWVEDKDSIDECFFSLTSETWGMNTWEWDVDTFSCITGSVWRAVVILCCGLLWPAIILSLPITLAFLVRFIRRLCKKRYNRVETLRAKIENREAKLK